MTSFWVVVVIMSSLAAGSLGTWLLMTFLRGQVNLEVDPDQLEVILKLHVLETDLEARGDYYERVAKTRGMPRKDRFPSFEAWTRINRDR